MFYFSTSRINFMFISTQQKYCILKIKTFGTSVKLIQSFYKSLWTLHIENQDVLKGLHQLLTELATLWVFIKIQSLLFIKNRPFAHIQSMFFCYPQHPSNYPYLTDLMKLISIKGNPQLITLTLLFISNNTFLISLIRTACSKYYAALMWCY